MDYLLVLFQHDLVDANLDLGVLPVWAAGITGKNVVVSVLDDGEFVFLFTKLYFQDKRIDFNMFMNLLLF